MELEDTEVHGDSEVIELVRHETCQESILPMGMDQI
jgi:hypothetical protein